MGDVIERLFTLIPVAIGVIWVLRFVGRRRKSNALKSGPAVKKPIQIKSPGDREKTESEEASRKVRDPVSGIVRFMFGDEEAAPASAGPPIRKDIGPGSAYRRVREANGSDQTSAPVASSATDGDSKPRSSPSRTGTTERLVTRRAERDVVRADTVFDRIESLSPLARGVIWSQILGKPKSLEDTKP